MNPYNHNHPPPQSSLPQPNTMPHGLHQQLPSLATANNYPPPLPHHQQQQQHLPSMAPPSATASYGDVPSNYAPGPMQDRQQQQPQPSPTASTPRAPSPGQLERTAEALRPHSHVVNGRRYTLEVKQQPVRARMCGFGDKDRRPITPPPAVKLIVTDVATGKMVDVNTIEYSHYVLMVDLWDETAQKEVNLVRSTTATPSISSTSQESFGNIERNPLGVTGAGAGHIAPYPQHSSMNMYGQPPPPVNYGQNPYSQVPHYQPPPQGYAPQQQPYFAQPDYGMVPSQGPGGRHVPSYGPPQMFDHSMAMGHRLSYQSNSQPQGMFTRNLIGSLAASAFRLTDPEDNIGIWFILQDLSVRTEGNFRLRFSFVDVRPKIGQPGNEPVATGKTLVTASCFSDVFQVYSAKKFPGVCESTPLSKTFATQGIKIPIRKEGTAGKGGGNDFDDDDE